MVASSSSPTTGLRPPFLQPCQAADDMLSNKPLIIKFFNKTS
jgi:hypothetical protein